MRKVLLATTAIVAVAISGAAKADSTSPITLNVGGYDDFIAGYDHEAQGTSPGKGNRSHGDFENEYKLNFDALGKASNGVQYGANISLWNGPEVTNLWAGGGNGIFLNSAYVWLSGAFGKVLFGDEHGASDLQVYAPTVGEGQIDGRYMDFVDPTSLARVYASGIDNTEHSTKITYYTPKVGNDANKVQLGVSYTPSLYDYGSNVTKYNNTGVTNGVASPYNNVVKAAGEFWGNWHPVNLAASANIQTGNGGANGGTGSTNPALFSTAPTGVGFQDYTSWGVGAQLGFSGLAGFTLGGSYQDLGRYGTVHGQNKNQDTWTVGAKYEFDKVGLAASYVTSSQYDNLLAGGTAGATVSSTNYVSSFNAWGLGATYTWFPGLTTNADGVIFEQGVANQADNNDGYVLLISQRLAF
ncbi:MAG TPA: porin [Alphaproteobacteria bacterium]|nr:porin [Alphaproteobacteria bacterium]